MLTNYTCIRLLGNGKYLQTPDRIVLGNIFIATQHETIGYWYR